MTPLTPKEMAQESFEAFAYEYRKRNPNLTDEDVMSMIENESDALRREHGQ